MKKENSKFEWKRETDKQVDPICFRPTRLVFEDLEELQRCYPGTSRNRIINDLLKEALWKIRSMNT